MLGATRRDFVSLVKGTIGPTDVTNTVLTPISTAQTWSDRVNEHLYAVMYLLTEKPVSLFVLKHQDESGTSGDWQKALQ